MINETNNLDRTAIVDCRGPDPGAFHDAYRAFAVRARLDREHGCHENQLIWEGPVPIIGDNECAINSFVAMDRWLSAVERDLSAAPLAQKIVANRPADLGLIPFTDDEWTRLQAVFPEGVCDYSRPGVDQQSTIPWLSYQDGAGNVVYGGQPLPPAPPGSGGGWGSGAFRVFAPAP